MVYWKKPEVIIIIPIWPGLTLAKWYENGAMTISQIILLPIRREVF